ncbi:MAG: three-Cys-motif partner protein TcmP [Promethearchaeota archaeon]
MSTKNTVWDLQPITEAKHEILKRYLDAWFPIISSIRRGMNYIDGFAGPGIYSKGEEGSPLIAMRTVLEHKLYSQLVKTPIRFHFIEKRKDRAEVLKSVLEERFSETHKNIEWEVYHSGFAQIMEEILSGLEERCKLLAPSFIFIDPFGFKGFPMVIIKRILDYKRCEVLVTFMEGFMKRFPDYNKKTLNDLFWTDEWQNYLEKGEKPLVNLYESQLLKHTQANYVRSFEMRKFGRTWYYLVFATRHLKGLEVMKKAMWKADPRGEYTFGDVKKGQTFLFQEGWHAKAADLIYENFAGKTVPKEDVWEFVIRDTPYLFRIKGVLDKLEKEGKIIKVERKDNKQRRKGSFPDGCTIYFESN